jgi:hypothetical protein
MLSRPSLTLLYAEQIEGRESMPRNATPSD